MKIGFFDSGIGGLTVLHEALRQFPQHEYIYYADTLHAPYGPKPKDEVRQYIFNAIAFLVEQEVEAVVIACNTATSIAVQDLRKQYDIPIIGMEPAVKPAIEYEGVKDKVLVTATPLTIQEEKLRRLIGRLCADEMTDLLALPNLVSFAEHFDFSDETVIPYLKEALADFDVTSYKAVVLGCTHFPLFVKQFKQLFSDDVQFIDGSQGTVKQLQALLHLSEAAATQKPKVTYYQSGVLATDEAISGFECILAQLNQ